MSLQKDLGSTGSYEQKPQCCGTCQGMLLGQLSFGLSPETRRGS